MRVEWHGEELRLLPERAIYWAARGTLLVADLHIGKDASFRRHGIPVPAAIGQADLDRLSRLIASTGARRLIVLGDLVHARSGMTDATDRLFREWRSRHRDLPVALVRGNHDRSAGDLPEAWGVDGVAEPFSADPFLLRHAPLTEPSRQPVLAGHLHPAVMLSGQGGARLTAPCFWMRKDVLILPAFTEFSGRTRIAPSPGDRIFVVGDDEVAEVPICVY